MILARYICIQYPLFSFDVFIVVPQDQTYISIDLRTISDDDSDSAIVIFVPCSTKPYHVNNLVIITMILYLNFDINIKGVLLLYPIVR